MSVMNHSAPNTDAISCIVPVTHVAPNPHNPRKRFDPEQLQELAASLASVGLLEPLIVRPIHDAAADTLRYELIAGERRWRAAQIAGLADVPVRVLDVDDKHAAELMLVENLQRADLDPIEEAEGYRRLQELGHTQQQIAERVHRAQPTIANRLRLLKLPSDVLELISAGKLSPSHGVALLQHYEGFPAVAIHVANWAVEGSIPVAVLEKGLGFVGYQVVEEMEKADLVRTLDYRTGFDIKVCNDCPFGAHQSSNYRHTCLRPEHYAELEAVTAAEIARKVAAAKEQLREAAQKDAKPGEAPVEVPDLPKLADLNYTQYEDVSGHVPGCDENCACRSLAIDRRGNVVSICTNPKRRQTLRAAETKNERKELKSGFGADLDQLVELQRQPDLAATSRALAVLARRCLSMARVEDLRAVAKTLPEGLLRTQLEKPPFSHNEGESWAVYIDHPIEQIIHVCVQVLARAEVREAVEYKHRQAPLLDWLLGRKAEEKPAQADTAEASPPGDDDDADDELEHCCRCGDALPADLLEVDGCTEDFALALHDPRGHVMLEDGPAYCAECWPQVRRCKGCGCTDEAGCPEGCEWVEEDLCSVYAEGRPTAAALCSVCAEGREVPA